MGFVRKVVGGYGEITYHPLRDAKTADDVRSINFQTHMILTEHMV